MVEAASCEDTISYTAVAERIGRVSGCVIEPTDPRFHDLLGEISTEEDAEKRGMLSVVVVHKDGDRKPGSGFFKLARELGRETSDEVAFWIEELTKVHSVWS